jgi:hypothetical protein
MTLVPKEMVKLDRGTDACWGRAGVNGNGELEAVC